MYCYFCKQNIEDIDYKNVDLLRKFIAASAKIKGRKKTGVCSHHQRKLSLAIKRARFLGLLPFVRY